MVKSGLTILIDMDDVLENLSSAWVNMLNKRYGTRVKREDLTDWDMSQFFPELTPDQVYGVLQDEELWETVEPLPGAVDGVRWLIEQGHDVYVVTSSYYKTIRPKVDLVLKKYFPFIKDDKLIIASTKQMIKGDVLIDDGVHNLICGTYEKILMDAPYNRSFPAEDYGMYRACGWPDILRFVRTIYKLRTEV